MLQLHFGSGETEAEHGGWRCGTKALIKSRETDTVLILGPASPTSQMMVVVTQIPVGTGLLQSCSGQITWLSHRRHRSQLFP